VLLKTKKGKEYEEFLEWYGSAPDLAAFHIDEMNNRLKKLPRAFRDSYELGKELSDSTVDFLERRY